MAHADKTQDSQRHRQPAAERASRSLAAPALADSSARAASLSAMARAIDHSPRVTAQRAFAAGLLNSPRLVAQRRQLGRVFGDAVRIEGPPRQGQPRQGKLASGVAQRTVRFIEPETRDRYNPARNANIKSSTYQSQYKKVNDLDESVTVLEMDSVSPGEGEFNSQTGLNGKEGRVAVHPLQGPATDDNPHFNDNISTLGHEFQHALDEFGTDKVDAFNHPTGAPERWNIIHTEWRAWAIEAAIVHEYVAGKKPEDIKLNRHKGKMLESFLEPHHMTLVSDEFFRKTQFYINKHVFKDTTQTYSETDTQTWMRNQGAAWLEEAVALFSAKIAGKEAPKEGGEILLGSREDIRAKAPEVATSPKDLVRVRKDGEYRIYSHKGRQLRVHSSLLESASEIFDQATGSWPAAKVEVETAEVDAGGEEIVLEPT